ncbi:hypothetical protein PAHAL_1G112700 [Panicum hallii]|nr:hypothetical protein PAHAL_1G112700 [Panicum hallii]
MTGCVILFPIAVTFYVTWWFFRFVDGFFSPIYAHLGINIFGLGFVTSIAFIFVVGVFMSSWLGASILGLGEWFIKRMPFVRHIYNASKQISAAISPDQNKHAFKEVVIIRHPRIGEYAFGFITSEVLLQVCLVSLLDSVDRPLCHIIMIIFHVFYLCNRIQGFLIFLVMLLAYCLKMMLLKNMMQPISSYTNSCCPAEVFLL